MSRSSSYYSSLGGIYESIEPSPAAHRSQHRPSQIPNQNVMPADSNAGYYLTPRHRPNHNVMPADSSAEYYLTPRHRPDQNVMPADSNAGYYLTPRQWPHSRTPAHPSNMRPGFSGTVPQSPVASRQDVIDGLPSRNMGDVPFHGEGTSHIALQRRTDNRASEDHHVAQIVREMEKDVTLMEDNPVSEQRRVEALREMPESLTIKRTIKRNLVHSVSRKSKRTSLSAWKMLKYRLSIYFKKLNVAIRNLLYMLELWYSSMKTIEGNFGSGVATYFRFLRWLFLLNTTVFLISFGFIVIPQLLYEPVEGSERHEMRSTFFIPSHPDGYFYLLEESNSTTYLLTPVPVTTANRKVGRSSDSASNVSFSFGDIFTGEGSFEDTALYHGYYTNESVSTVDGLTYRIPSAYFFTVLACYLFIFVVLSVSMARSYRRTFIETAGDTKDIFCHKVFCGWDFSIATDDAAALKSNSIYNELQELLGDVMKEDTELTAQERCCVSTVRIGLIAFVGLLLASSGLLIWFLLRWEWGIEDPTAGERETTMVVPIIITVIMMVAPVLFSWMTSVEDYANPRTALFVTLTKTFLMEAVMIGIVVAFWVTFRESSTCWETSLGQEVYRLVIIDFLFAIVGTSLAEFVRSQIYERISKNIGVPEFDIARNTMNIIYNQTLFFVGFYFSPLLAFVITFKMFVTFYIRKLGLLHSCRPSTRPWRAAQTQTLFLVLSFMATLIVLIFLGYIVTQVESSDCGPFRNCTYPYDVILDVFQVRDDSNGFIQFIGFITKPGVIGGILLAMCVGVYYLHAQSRAHKSMVRLLREMLVMEAKDKEFLLNNITRVTESRINVSAAHRGSPEHERRRLQTGVREQRF